MHFGGDRLAELGWGILEAWLDECGIFFRAKIRVLVFVVENPALTFGHDSLAEFFGCKFVSPLSERALGELLDVALMYQRDCFASAFERMLNRHAHQAFRGKNRNRFDADSRVGPHLLLATLQHFFIEKFDQLGGFGCTLLPLDSGINVFCVLAKDDYVHALGIFHGRRRAFVILHWTDAGVEIKYLPQGDVERANAATDGRCQRPLNRDAKFADCVNRVLRKPVVEFGFGLFSREDFIPDHSPLALVGLLDGGVEDTYRGLPDIAACTVALDERNDRIRRYLNASIFVGDARPILGHSHTVV